MNDLPPLIDPLNLSRITIINPLQLIRIIRRSSLSQLLTTENPTYRVTIQKKRKSFHPETRTSTFTLLFKRDKESEGSGSVICRFGLLRAMRNAVSNNFFFSFFLGLVQFVLDYSGCICL